jgi:hypothetical protein
MGGFVVENDHVTIHNHYLAHFPSQAAIQSHGIVDTRSPFFFWRVVLRSERNGVHGAWRVYSITSWISSLSTEEGAASGSLLTDADILLICELKMGLSNEEEKSWGRPR